MNEAPQQPTFGIEKIYVKDLSLEIPHAPEVFLVGEQPQVDVQLHNEGAAVSDGLYQVVLTVTVTAKAGDKTMFLVEAAQAGIFQIRNVPESDSSLCSRPPARTSCFPMRARRCPTSSAAPVFRPCIWRRSISRRSTCSGCSRRRNRPRPRSRSHTERMRRLLILFLLLPAPAAWAAEYRSIGENARDLCTTRPRSRRTSCSWRAGAIPWRSSSKSTTGPRCATSPAISPGWRKRTCPMAHGGGYGGARGRAAEAGRRRAAGVPGTNTGSRWKSSSSGAGPWVKVRHRDGQSGYVRANQVWGLS